jgi:hypothetical protein
MGALNKILDEMFQRCWSLPDNPTKEPWVCRTSIIYIHNIRTTSPASASKQASTVPWAALQSAQSLIEFKTSIGERAVSPGAPCCHGRSLVCTYFAERLGVDLLNIEDDRARAKKWKATVELYGELTALINLANETPFYGFFRALYEGAIRRLFV